MEVIFTVAVFLCEAKPYVYIILGITVVVFTVILLISVRLQRRPHYYTPDNIDESVDKAAEKIKKPQNNPTSQAVTAQVDEHVPGEKPKETVVHVLYNHALKTWQVEFRTEDEIVPHGTAPTKAEAIIDAKKICDTTLWPLVIHNKYE